MPSYIELITGRDSEVLNKRPCLIGRNIKMYSESNETRQAYLDMPKGHPV